jgi:RHH-type proline utilization regulon transcriptional repressor/proline dehydrogenase/delta 1-pyrroline-5-carboxylate dehydrogenase
MKLEEASNPESHGLRELMAGFEPDPALKHDERVQRTLFVARRLQERAVQLLTPAERRQQAELERMFQLPRDKATLVQITDEAFRAKDPHRAVDQLIHILDVQGIPRFFSPIDRTLLKGFQSFGGFLPGVALPLVRESMQRETANVILPAEREMLSRHLGARVRVGLRMNLNLLGEAILGEGEAEARLLEYLQLLQWPEIEAVSVKISTLYSQISPLAHEHTVATLCDRLEMLCRTAVNLQFTRIDGSQVSKFVYLDMEEYRDLELTAEVFMKTLDRPGLESARAGIALQAYIPDSYAVLQRLQDWARQRVAGGGSRVTVRLVKGANLEMERVEASLRGWAQAPYRTKMETDANYRRMIGESLKRENLAAMDVGIASHNLFEVAYGLVLANERDAFDKVQFEMLEGMANHQRRAMFELTRNLLLYAPACRKENFINAIGYLVRRLDENTGPDNFLRHAFKLRVGSPEWTRLERGFLDAQAAVDTVSRLPRRRQDRREPPPEQSSALAQGWQKFVNEPDTDFTLPQQVAWAQQLIAGWETRCGDKAPRIPIVVAGEELFADAQGTGDARQVAERGTRGWRECLDPSRPGVVVGRYTQATPGDIRRAADCAAADPDGWRSLLPSQRAEALGRVAQEIRNARGELMGAALADGGKTLLESDPEVSEAVDFVEFYRATACWWQEMETMRARPKGVVVVVSPWNFPIAIPCGGVAAALATGNTVILKPASDTVLVAWELCGCFWRAGVSKRVLQFVPCAGGGEGRQLVGDPKVNAVVLTGGTETARAMLRDNPRLTLFGETGGKNATIVTALSDRDQAIKHVLHSAFSHSGQKCSATSLLLLEAEVYDDPEFRRALVDAVRSIRVGSAWALETRMGPLIRPPTGDLENALKGLEPGEEWAVMPRQLEGNPQLWSPGVKYGVRPGSDTHLTEFFGPVLGVMRFNTLREAVNLVNQTGYGLTSGIESLDERERDYWMERIRAGNLYVNRVTTGAVVLRQPFGGSGKSVFGLGMKAGGPNYVAQLMDFSDNPGMPERAEPESEPLRELCRQMTDRGDSAGITPDETRRIVAAVVSYERAQDNEFCRSHDHFLLIGQDNLRRYRPFREIRLRVHETDGAFDLFARVCAAQVVGGRITVSLPPGHEKPLVTLLESITEPWAGAIEFIEETDAELAQTIAERQTDLVRYAGLERVPTEVFAAGAAAGVRVAAMPVVLEGRLELLWYLEEQSVSIDYHRYGNLGARAGERRTEPA